MSDGPPVRWFDSAAVGAGLFLNYFFLANPVAPFKLARDPANLLVQAAFYGLVAAGVYWLVMLGGGLRWDRPPFESWVGRIAFVGAVFGLTLYLAALCLHQIVRDYAELWPRLTDAPGFLIDQAAA